MGAPVKYKEDMCETVKQVLGSGKSLAAVCCALEISRPTLYVWKGTYPEFKDALDVGLQKGQAYWEEKGERGIDGEIKNFGASPWIFTMKNRFREDYAEEKEKSNSDSLVEKLIDKLVD